MWRVQVVPCMRDCSWSSLDGGRRRMVVVANDIYDAGSAGVSVAAGRVVSQTRIPEA